MCQCSYFQLVIWEQAGLEESVPLIYILYISGKKKSIWDDMEKQWKEVMKAMEKIIVAFCIKMTTFRIYAKYFYFKWEVYSAENYITSFVLSNKIIFSNPFLILNISLSLKKKLQII